MDGKNRERGEKLPMTLLWHEKSERLKLEVSTRYSSMERDGWMNPSPALMVHDAQVARDKLVVQ
jgi:hypothetical protein